MMGATQHCSVLNLGDASAMRRVVIVADSTLVVHAIRIGLHDSGDFKLVGTANARTTSARIILGPAPDVILFDDMERSDRALELLGDIRREDEHVPVLMLSIHLDPDWLGRLFSAGASGVISRATRPAVLATLVRESLDGHIVHRPPMAAERQGTSRKPGSVNRAPASHSLQCNERVGAVSGLSDWRTRRHAHELTVA
jgi:DNA-binding NarL/FixJ family response regulator